jgi:hypothetical protein
MISILRMQLNIELKTITRNAFTITSIKRSPVFVGLSFITMYVRTSRLVREII